MTTSKTALTTFCPCCIASSEDGSWGYYVVDGHCYNCGASGSSITIPKWAVASIRQQASWEGQRFPDVEGQLAAR